MNKSRLIFAILIALGCALAPAVVFADGPGELEQALKQRNLPTVSATAPTDGQVMTWDSTLGKAKWAAAGGGGGSFDPDAAVAITFADSVAGIIGPSNIALGITAGGSRDLTLSAGTPVNAHGTSVSLIANSGAGTNKNGGSIIGWIGNKTGSGEPGSFVVQDESSHALFSVSYAGVVTGPADNHFYIRPGVGTSLYMESTSDATGPSGDIGLTIGGTTDGDTGYLILSTVTPTGTNKSAGDMQFFLGNCTGSGTPSNFQVYDADATRLFEIGYDGTVTGPTGAAFNIEAASSQSLNLTAPNQILLNSAGHYVRMGNGFLNLPSDGGLYFCSETTASTTDMKIYRGGTRVIKVASSLTGDDIDRPMYFSTRSCEGANLTSGIDIYSANGTTSLTSLWGGAYGGSSTLQLVAGGTTVTINSNGLTSSAARFTVGTSGPTITSGSGSPESSVTAGPGSIYLRTGGGAGTSFYVKESGTGNTGWVAK